MKHNIIIPQALSLSAEYLPFHHISERRKYKWNVIFNCLCKDFCYGNGWEYLTTGISEEEKSVTSTRCDLLAGFV